MAVLPFPTPTATGNAAEARPRREALPGAAHPCPCWCVDSSVRRRHPGSWQRKRPREEARATRPSTGQLRGAVNHAPDTPGPPPFPPSTFSRSLLAPSPQQRPGSAWSLLGSSSGSHSHARHDTGCRPRAPPGRTPTVLGGARSPQGSVSTEPGRGDCRGEAFLLRTTPSSPQSGPGSVNEQSSFGRANPQHGSAADVGREARAPPPPGLSRGAAARRCPHGRSVSTTQPAGIRQRRQRLGGPAGKNHALTRLRPPAQERGTALG